ncbi:hypothetical protein NLI96_g654 [Meripilus lineatus]|uniref:Uncharacterized protein n=1 Tax=Meripilus lineatus TaxID=2056292 RepID=A0AAD5VEG4_9APHY|nr:hypothetical protein NLI96_g654 [Physisporinus lineatus]
MSQYTLDEERIFRKATADQKVFSRGLKPLSTDPKDWTVVFDASPVFDDPEDITDLRSSERSTRQDSTSPLSPVDSARGPFRSGSASTNDMVPPPRRSSLLLRRKLALPHLKSPFTRRRSTNTSSPLSQTSESESEGSVLSTPSPLTPASIPSQSVRDGVCPKDGSDGKKKPWIFSIFRS